MKPALRNILLLIIAFSILSIGSMLYVSWSGENKSRSFCESIIIGKSFDWTEYGDKKPLERTEDGVHFYLYLFPMNFDETASCKVIIDSENIVTDKLLEIY